MYVILSMILGISAPGSVPSTTEDSIDLVRQFCKTAQIELPPNRDSVSVYLPTRAIEAWRIQWQGIGTFSLNSETAAVSRFSSDLIWQLKKDRPSKSQRGEIPAFSSEEEAKEHMVALAKKLGVPENWNVDPIDVRPDGYDDFDGLVEPGRYFLRMRQPTNKVVFESWNNASISVDYITGQLTSFSYFNRIDIVVSTPRIARAVAVSSATQAFNESKRRGDTIVKSVDLGYFVSRHDRWNTPISMPLKAHLVWRVGFDSPGHIKPEYAYISATTGLVIEVNHYR